MADLFGSRQYVAINDGTALGNNAVVTNATPGGSDYGLVVRPVGTGTVDTELPAAAALADGFANPTAPAVGAHGMVWNGATWDRLAGAATGGVQVQGWTAHDGALAAGFPLVIGGRAQATAPTDVSAAGDAVRGWFLLNGAQATVLTAAGALIGGDATNGLDVDVTRVTGTVTVDSELPAAAALADAVANPTVPAVGGYLVGYNGTTWDRVRTANTGRLQVDVITGGGGSSIVDNAAFTDGTSPVLPVGFIFDEVAGTALTENDAAAARIDSKRALIGTIEDATTRGQRAAVSAGGALATNLLQVAGGTAITAGVTGSQAIGGALAHDAAGAALFPLGVGFFASAAAPAAVSADGDLVKGWALLNGSQVVNLASGGTLITAGQKAMAASLPVVIASDQATFPVTADTELSAAAAAADAFANPTSGGALAFGMGYNGTTWDRIRTANTGRLQVDIVTGGGSPAASGLPTSYNMVDVYGSTSATAAAGTATVVTNTPANTKLFYVRGYSVAASGQTKAQLKFGAAVKHTAFIPQAVLTMSFLFDPPIPGTGDGATALTVDVTNREASAMDLYARLNAIVQA